MAVLLKSLRSGKAMCSESAQALSAKNESTLTPTTCPPTRASSAMPSRNVHISDVQVPLNAAGKKASTTGPRPHTSLSVTDWRSWSGSVRSGAAEPTVIAINYACGAGAAGAAPSRTTCTLSVTVTSRWSLSGTSCSPSALMASGRMSLRRS